MCTERIKTGIKVDRCTFASLFVGVDQEPRSLINGGWLKTPQLCNSDEELGKYSSCRLNYLYHVNLCASCSVTKLESFHDSWSVGDRCLFVWINSHNTFKDCAPSTAISRWHQRIRCLTKVEAYCQRWRVVNVKSLIPEVHAVYNGPAPVVAESRLTWRCQELASDVSYVTSLSGLLRQCKWHCCANRLSHANCTGCVRQLRVRT